MTYLKTPCKMRINNADHSKAVQEWLFEQGCRWRSYTSEPEVKNFTISHLYCNADDIISYTNKEREGVYLNKDFPEINVSHLDPHLNKGETEMLKLTKDSYCDVRGWPEELVKKAAEMMSEDTGVNIWGDYIALKISNRCYHLRLHKTDDHIGVFSYSNTVGKEIARSQVEQMIKERSAPPSKQSSSIERLTTASEALTQAYKAYKEALERVGRDMQGVAVIEPYMVLYANDEEVV